MNEQGEGEKKNIAVSDKGDGDVFERRERLNGSLGSRLPITGVRASCHRS